MQNVKLGVVSFNTLIEHSHFPLNFRPQMNMFGSNLLQDHLVNAKIMQSERGSTGTVS